MLEQLTNLELFLLLYLLPTVISHWGVYVAERINDKGYRIKLKTLPHDYHNGILLSYTPIMNLVFAPLTVLVVIIKFSPRLDKEIF